MANQSNRTTRSIQSVSRALDILEVLSASGEETTLGEIAEATGLNVSTCHHILLTLMNRGYVGQNKRGAGYYLGSRFLSLSSSDLRRTSLVELAMPELRALNHATQENVHLAVMQGTDLEILAGIESPLAVRAHTDVIDFSTAAHATAIGKSILAWLPDSEIANIMAEKGLARFTANTITNPAELMEALRLVRRYGFAFDREELLPGVACVGTAIRDNAGTVLGSISCTLPQSRATEAAIEMIKEQVIACVSVLGEKLSLSQGQAA